MARSSQTERVHRVNSALALLHDNMAFREAADVLIKRFKVSKRQAYRYLQEACQTSTPLPSPEDKAVFTVRLPVALIDQLRHHPRVQGQSLSDFVCQALTHALEEPCLRRHGRSQS